MDGVASIALRGGHVTDPVGSKPAAPERALPLVLGGENAFLAAVVEHLLRAQTPWLAPRVLIFGPRGSGKSRLLQGLAAAWRQRGLRVTCLAACEVAQHDGGDPPNGDADREDAATGAADGPALRAWLVDDVERIAGRGEAQQRLAAWLDQRWEADELVVLASREAPWSLANFEGRLRSRLAAALCVGIRPPAPPTRAALVRQFAETAGHHLSDEAAAYLARRWNGTPGALSARVAELLSRLGGARCDLRQVRRAASALRRGSAVTLRRIAARTAAHFGQSLEAVLGKARHRQVMVARSVAIYLARHLASATLPQIGRFFGGRDHTTVLHHCRQVEQRLLNDASLRDTVEQLTWALRPRRRRATRRPAGG